MVASVKPGDSPVDAVSAPIGTCGPACQDRLHSPQRKRCQANMNLRSVGFPGELVPTEGKCDETFRTIGAHFFLVILLPARLLSDISGTRGCPNWNLSQSRLQVWVLLRKTNKNTTGVFHVVPVDRFSTNASSSSRQNEKRLQMDEQSREGFACGSFWESKSIALGEGLQTNFQEGALKSCSMWLLSALSIHTRKIQREFSFRLQAISLKASFGRSIVSLNGEASFRLLHTQSTVVKLIKWTCYLQRVGIPSSLGEMCGSSAQCLEHGIQLCSCCPPNYHVVPVCRVFQSPQSRTLAITILLLMQNGYGFLKFQNKVQRSWKKFSLPKKLLSFLSFVCFVSPGKEEEVEEEGLPAEIEKTKSVSRWL